MITFAGIRTFGFVRNPYTRFLSAWDEHRFQHRLSDETNLDDWIRTHLTPANIRYDWRYIHFCPQHFFFYSGRKSIADFIGRFEHIDDSWFAIQKLLGLSIPLGTTNVKGGTRTRSIDSLSAESIRKINELYDLDFSLFGYRKYVDMADIQASHTPTSYADEVRNGLLPERVAVRSMLEQKVAEAREHELLTWRDQLADAQSHLADARSQLADTQTRLAQTQTGFDTATAQLVTMHAEIKNVRTELDAARGTIAIQAQSLEAARQAAVQSAATLAETQSELDRVMRSRSMRYTSWLRKAGHFFR
ncbi:sulfotransferase family 2 domain-containing protein [Burkholderia multivorans]|uniref:sulfotransferase family 2 domain-containing protein n=1 Tax=Burkholderia multivorans TaxID=87883 RepID=UPI002870ABAB|nr:sulfotransferase family 2 domain-containing protein [Burkholderia multivorans]